VRGGNDQSGFKGELPSTEQASKKLGFVGKGIQGSLKVPTQTIPSRGTNISHHWERNMIFKCLFWRGPGGYPKLRGNHSDLA